MKRLSEIYKKRKWIHSLMKIGVSEQSDCGACLPLSIVLIDEAKTNEEQFFTQETLLLVGLSLLMDWIKLWICLHNTIEWTQFSILKAFASCTSMITNCTL